MDGHVKDAVLRLLTGLVGVAELATAGDLGSVELLEELA